jgi:methylglutaconyl-CoA hydratase
MGGGNGLACAADITVASEAASFALSEVRLGLVPGVISPFVVRRVGPSWARALFLLGEKVPAREAARVGLVHYVTAGASPDDTAALDARVEALVASLVKGSPDAQQRCKRLVEAVQYQEPAEVLDVSAQFIAEARESADAREGIMAFLEKRPAAWIPGAGADAAEGA